MSRLEEIFDRQAHPQAAAPSAGARTEEESDYIRFEVGSSLYAVPIAAVREVLERQRIASYPREVPGHLGIISIRGQIIPVLGLPGAADAGGLEADPAARLLVLEFEPGRVFALLGLSPRKITLAASWKAGDTAESEGRPVRLLAASAFSQETEASQ